MMLYCAPPLLCLPCTRTCSVGQLVSEKEARIRMMMKMHGLQDGAYWAVQYLWFLMLYAVYAAAYLAFGAITDLAIVKHNDAGAYARGVWRCVLLVCVATPRVLPPIVLGCAAVCSVCVSAAVGLQASRLPCCLCGATP